MTEISICIGSSCHIKGSYNVIQIFQQLIEEYDLHENLQLKASFCLKNCSCDKINIALGEETFSINPEDTTAFFHSTVLPMVKGN